MKFVRSLKGRLTIIVAIAIVITGTVVLLFTYFIARSVIREQVFRSMEGVVSRTVAEVQLALRAASPALDAVAENPQLAADIAAYAANPDKASLQADINSLIGSEVASSSTIMGVMVTGTDGSVITAVKGPADGGALKIPDSQLLGELKPGRAVLTFSVGNDGLTIIKVFPVTSTETNKVIGAVVSNTRSPVLESELIAHYRDCRRLDAPGFSPEAFERAYRVLAALRASRILGVFARLARRDGRLSYLEHYPRMTAYLSRSLAHPAMAGLRLWYERHGAVA